MSTLAPIYLDNAATTRADPKVVALMSECMLDSFGNPSSAHRAGIDAGRRLKTAKGQLQTAIGDPSGVHGRILWTSGGTESDALGVLGAARSHKNTRTVVCSQIEHPAVAMAAAMLGDRGWRVARLPVTNSGTIDPDLVGKLIDSDTAIVAVMLVNNEIGTILPVAQIAANAKAIDPNIHVHCDAIQALGKIEVDVATLGVDSVAFAAHKLHGPKGVGALWVKKGIHLQPFWTGGGQQDGLRSGTENVPGIAGFGAAVELACSDLSTQMARYESFADMITKACRDARLRFRVNGSGAKRASHILSLAFDSCPAEPLLHTLESRGVLVSAGSACSQQRRKPSEVLSAIAVPPSYGTLRFSFGRTTNAEEIMNASEILVDAVQNFQI